MKCKVMSFKNERTAREENTTSTKKGSSYDTSKLFEVVCIIKCFIYNRKKKIPTTKRVAAKSDGPRKK